MLKLTVITGALGGLIVLAITPFVMKFASLNDTAMHYLKYMLLINTYYIMGSAVNTALDCRCLSGRGRYEIWLNL